MGEQKLLTDRRREIISEEYDPSDASNRQLKWRLKKDTETTLKELVEIARSPTIDNSEFFDPGLIEQLITALYTSGDFEPFRTFDGDRTEYSDKIHYQLGLHNRLGRVNREFSNLAHEDPDVHTGLIPPEGYEGIDEDDD
jgi:hypothetical protein